MKFIALFASGNGTNAKAIIQYFHLHPRIKIECIICNNPKAKAIEVANQANIPFYLITKNDLYETGKVIELLKKHHIDLIVLAGFLWIIPKELLDSFPKKIINIHPALLPKYGGEGMYGMHIHNRVISGKETETGITIHYLNERFDEGEIIFQKAIDVQENDSAETIALKVQQLEHQWYPKIIERLLAS